MPYIPNQQQNTGSFVPTTNVWDVSHIYEVDVRSPEFKELIVRLYQNINTVALALNNKDSGYYIEQEFVNSQLFFNPNEVNVNNPLTLRPVFRSTFDIGALGAGLTATNHNLIPDALWKFTRIYGVVSDTVGFNYYPLPFASAGGAANIELRVNATQILITNNSGVAFTDCYVVLEYVKN